MSTTCNNDSEHALWVAEMIEKYGHAIICVGTGDCRAPGCRCEPEPVPWCYTIGLVDEGLPELVAFGLDEEGSLIMLNWAAGRARCPDCGVEPGRVVHLGGLHVRFDEVPADWATDFAVDPIGRWWAHYAPGREWLDPPRVVQCVWADAAGRFPDDPGCDPAVVACQPVAERLLDDWTGHGNVVPLNRAERRARRHRR